MLIARLLQSGLAPLVKTGSLSFTFSNGERVELGDGTGPPVAVSFTDPRAPWALLLDPDLRSGELFTDGRMVIDQGSVYEMLHIVLRHGDQTKPSWPSAWLDAFRSLVRRLGPGRGASGGPCGADSPIPW